MSWISLGIQSSSTSVPVCLVRLMENRAWAKPLSTLALPGYGVWPMVKHRQRISVPGFLFWTLREADMLISTGFEPGRTKPRSCLSWGELVGEVSPHWASRDEKQKPGSLHTRGPLDQVIRTTKFISLHDLWQQPTFQFLGLASLVRGSIIRIKNLSIGTRMIWRLPVSYKG